MGAAQSAIRLPLKPMTHTQIPALIVSLDALGTLYRFRAPVAAQYKEVAQRCGLDVDVDLHDLGSAFKEAYKRQSSSYPNYGKGRLQSPEAWWTMLIEDTFKQLVGEHSTPSHLGVELYKHFSSSRAYELYPDTVPFLQSMRALREQYTDPDGPLVTVGIITNSDPRVYDILSALGLRAGSVKMPKMFDIPDRETLEEMNTPGFVYSPFRDMYNPQNDVDFVVTSYDAGAEKPASGIWKYAQQQNQHMVNSRTERANEASQASDTASLNRSSDPGQQRRAMGALRAALTSTRAAMRVRVENARWIHIGNEKEKDFEGAQSYGHEALHLERSTDGAADDTVPTVSSLQEAAMIVNVVARDHFKANPPIVPASV